MRWVVVIVVALCACDRHSITATSFTVYRGDGGGCSVVADLISTRDSSNVDLEVRACGGQDCSLPSEGHPTRGSFRPGRIRTESFGFGSCPTSIDRLAIKVSRWGSSTSLLRGFTIDGVERQPQGNGCSVHAQVATDDALGFGDSISLVARSADGKPAAVSLLGASRVDPPWPARVEAIFNVPCEQVHTVELQPH
jgi:hypothetical protein